MRIVRNVWHFVAGDARSTPLAIAGAVLTALAFERLAPGAPAGAVAIAYTAILAAGLVAAVQERP